MFKDWIVKVAGDKSKAKCRYCKHMINAKLFDLKKHAETKKHQLAPQPFVSSLQTKIPFKPEKTILEGERAPAALCLFVAEHCSILTVMYEK